MGPAVVPNGRDYGAAIGCGLRPLRAVGSLHEPEAVGAIGAYPPACKPKAYNLRAGSGPGGKAETRKANGD